MPLLGITSSSSGSIPRAKISWSRCSFAVINCILRTGKTENANRSNANQEISKLLPPLANWIEGGDFGLLKSENLSRVAQVIFEKSEHVRYLDFQIGKPKRFRAAAELASKLTGGDFGLVKNAIPNVWSRIMQLQFGHWPRGNWNLEKVAQFRSNFCPDDRCATGNRWAKEGLLLLLCTGKGRVK